MFNHNVKQGGYINGLHVQKDINVQTSDIDHKHGREKLQKLTQLKKKP